MLSPTIMPTRETAQPDRPHPVETDSHHFVSGKPLAGPFPEGLEMAMFAMGCFWGPEKLFWDQPGVWVTAVGYSGGYTANPTYEDMKLGRTGHAEVVRIVFDPTLISYEKLLQLFWEGHNPLTGMRQGVDEGTQYRPVIFYFDDAQRELAEQTRDDYQQVLAEKGLGPIETKIEQAGPFYFAEGYHQAHDAKNPTGYCDNGLGIPCPIGRR